MNGAFSLCNWRLHHQHQNNFVCIKRLQINTYLSDINENVYPLVEILCTFECCLAILFILGYMEWDVTRLNQHNADGLFELGLIHICARLAVFLVISVVSFGENVK